MELFHKLFARCQNTRLGRWENLWSNHEPTLTRLCDRETVIKKLIYTATNPVKDLLVERVHHWPGVNGYTALMAGRPLKARRPHHFFNPNGPLPETVTLDLTIPAELGPPDAVLAELHAGVHAVEEDMRTRRARTGARVLGSRRIRSQSFTDAPTTVEPRRTLRPRFAGLPDARIAALLRYKLFLFTYADARSRWIAGRAALFPAGTYALARSASITVAPLATPAPIFG